MATLATLFFHIPSPLYFLSYGAATWTDGCAATWTDVSATDISGTGDSVIGLQMRILERGTLIRTLQHGHLLSWTFRIHDR